MKGLELCERYYREIGRPALERSCPELLPHLAAGLVGEGSECLGLDDELSRDHDWGPGFCLWLTDEDYDRFGSTVQKVYTSLPRSFLGFERLCENELSGGRVGVMRIGDFYERFLGLRQAPRTAGEWLSLGDTALCLATNGELFEDGPGIFTGIRKELAAYYPEDIRLKHLAARCAMASRAGQYQLPRCLQRGAAAAAYRCQADFVEQAEAILFLLARRYRPYYKWSQRMLAQLPGMEHAAGLLAELSVAAPDGAAGIVEELCALIARLLREQGLSRDDDPFLLKQAEAVQASIQREGLRSLPLFSFP